MMLRAAACLVLLLGLAAAYGQPAAAAPGQELLPEQSAAKAKAVLQQVITALGGRAYLNVRDFECNGRIAQFGNNGALNAFTQFHDLWLLPDKHRTEFAKGEIIELFAGDQGWMLDKAGVSAQPEEAVKDFTEQVKSGMNNMLRSRINETGVEFHYAGTDVLDLKEAEWIEFSDRDHRALRLAVEKSTHLPLRWVVSTRNPETRERTEIATSYTQYVPIDGVRTSLSIARVQNGREVSQTNLASCKYNADLSPQLFTRASLEQRSGEGTKKGYKDGKDKK